MARVTEDDPRYDEWPSRKPSKKERTAEKVARVVGGGELAKEAAKVVVPGLVLSGKGAIRRGVTALKNVNLPVTRSAASTVALGAPGTLGLIAAVGLGSYALTRYLIDNFPTKERRLFNLSVATGKYRAEKARQLGRALTKAEQDEISATYKAARANIERSPI